MKKSPVGHLFYLLLISILIFAVYSPAINASLLNWDDDIYILNNDLIKTLSWENFRRIFSEYFYGNYHPLTLISFSFEYAIAGTKPQLYHFNNLLLHLVNTLLIFFICRKLFPAAETAIVVSLLFGIHTLNVESVAWVSERKNVLYSFFFFLSLFYYIDYLDIKTKTRCTVSLLLSLLFFVFSLLSKGQAVTLAVALLLIDYLKGRKLWSWKLIAEKIPFFVLSLVFGIIALDAQQSADAVKIDTVVTGIDRIAVACYGFFQYFIKLLLPLNLSAIYPYPEKTGMLMWLHIIPAILVVFLVIHQFNRNRTVVFALLFYAFNLLPVLQIIPVGNVIMADRYAYIPSIGVFLLAAHFYSSIRNKRPLVKAGKLMRKRTGVYLQRGGIVFAVILCLLTWNRSRVWRTSLEIWNDVLSKYPDIPEALNNRGTEKRLSGDFNGAIADYNKAISKKPDFEMAWYNRGLVNYYLKNYPEAISDFTEAIEHKAGYTDALSNRGMCYALLGKFLHAIEDFSKTISLNDRDPYSWFNRGLAFYQNHQKEKASKQDFLRDTCLQSAVRDFTNAINLSQKMGGAYLYRGLSEIELNRKAEGCEDIASAGRLGIKEAPEYYQRLCSE